jgi:hypothetical protein
MAARGTAARGPGAGARAGPAGARAAVLARLSVFRRGLAAVPSPRPVHGARHRSPAVLVRADPLPVGRDQRDRFHHLLRPTVLPDRAWPAAVRRDLGHARALPSERARGPRVLGHADRLLPVCPLSEPALAPCPFRDRHRRRRPARGPHRAAGRSGRGPGQRDGTGLRAQRQHRAHLELWLPSRGALRLVHPLDDRRGAERPADVLPGRDPGQRAGQGGRVPPDLRGHGCARPQRLPHHDAGEPPPVPRPPQCRRPRQPRPLLRIRGPHAERRDAADLCALLGELRRHAAIGVAGHGDASPARPDEGDDLGRLQDHPAPLVPSPDRLAMGARHGADRRPLWGVGQRAVAGVLDLLLDRARALLRHRRLRRRPPVGSTRGDEPRPGAPGGGGRGPARAPARGQRAPGLQPASLEGGDRRGSEGAGAACLRAQGPGPERPVPSRGLRRAFPPAHAGDAARSPQRRRRASPRPPHRCLSFLGQGRGPAQPASGGARRPRRAHRGAAHAGGDRAAAPLPAREEEAASRALSSRSTARRAPSRGHRSWRPRGDGSRPGSRARDPRAGPWDRRSASPPPSRPQRTGPGPRTPW